MRCVHVDDSEWPVVTVSFDGKQTDEDVEHFIRRMDQIYARAERFVTLARIGKYSPNFGQVSRLGSWTKTRPEAATILRGVAIVVPSPKFRFLISSFLLIWVPPYPFVAFDDVPSARTWLRARLVEERMTVPASFA